MHGTIEDDGEGGGREGQWERTALHSIGFPSCELDMMMVWFVLWLVSVRVRCGGSGS